MKPWGHLVEAEDKFKIMAKYRGNAPEEVDTASTRQEAKYLLKEYELAYGVKSMGSRRGPHAADWQLWIEKS
jgi:hypothetical protein